LAQTTSKNYIKNTTYQVKTTDGEHKSGTTTDLTDDDKIESITYFDGLGRPIQSIAKQAGGDREDIITSMGYDEYGRQLREYLPYARTNSTLDFDVSLLPDGTGNITALNTQYLSKYADDFTGVVNPYSETVLEPSPLGRVMEQAAPGSDWAVGNGHTIEFEYQTNSLNPADAFIHTDSQGNYYDNVILFDVAHPTENGVLNTEKTELVYTGHYSANELYKTITKDENWTSGKDHTTEEFTNKQGQVILKRTFNDNVPHDTYYVYDDYGNLTYVLPPEASYQILEQDSAGRIASQVNYPWVSLVKVDKAFAEDYNKKLSEYENSAILNADIENAYGGQGGFTVTTLEYSEQVLLSINFSATTALELKTGELISLKTYGSFKDTELGQISGDGYSYIFYIKSNAIHIDGSGKLNGINEVFDSTTKLAYNQDILWTSLADIDQKFASAHEKDVLDHAKNTGQYPLNVYLNNSYGGQGGLNVAIDEDDNMVLSFNISSAVPLSLRKGVIASLDSKRRFKNRYLGTLTSGGYNYDFILEENAITVRGSGSGLSFSGAMFPTTLTDPTHTVRTEVIEGLCYIYHYDYRNRLVEKKIPGKGWEHIVYDKLDRPILTQDAKLRLDNNWLFTKYDAFGRVVYTGMHSYLPNNSEHNSGRLELQANLNAQTIHNEVRGATVSNIDGVSLDYTNQSLPTTNLKLFTVNYYDSYDNLGLNNELLKQQDDMVYDASIAMNTKGLATVSKVRVLETSDWITSVSYYDEKGMPIYVASKNGYLHTTDVVKTDYDFVGKVIKTETQHNINSTNVNTVVVEDVFDHDHAGRLLTQDQSINGGAPELIVKNHYDELGQLESKDIGNTETSPLQTVNYTYNIRGWLKAINDDIYNDNDLFDFNINYNNPTPQGTALFNGNISETFWVTGNDNNQRGYDYTYDALNRIETANYRGNYELVGASNQFENYSLVGVDDAPGVTYDKNGNIISLRRFGLVGNDNAIDVIDDLNYEYETLSNKLLNVSDDGSIDGFNDGNVFDENNNNLNDYLYDINGNMVKDLNKGILEIEYNHLNLPTAITFSEGNAIGSDKILYVYDATGIKLNKTVIDMSDSNGINYKSNAITEYAGAFIYKKSGNYSHDGQFWIGNEAGQGLQMFSHPEGYVEPATDVSGNYDYVYQYKDHLGNIRLSYKDISTTSTPNLEILEENNYYPFGLKHKGYNDVVSANVNSVASKFKYNGKELNDELGLDWYDISARNYDAALGRWMNIDPLAEKFVETSPYVFAKNNPIFFVDPNGEEPVPGPFTGQGYRSSNGTITVTRITAGQRYALNVYYAIASASTGYVGVGVGFATASNEVTSGDGVDDTTATKAVVATQGASQVATDVINSEAVSGNKGNGKPSYIGDAYDKNGKKIVNGNPVKSVVNKANGIIQWAGVATALAEDPSASAKEALSKWTFQFADSFLAGGNINIAQEGLFNVYDENATVAGVESRLNAIHAGISIFLAGTDFDLDTEEGQADAAAYISANAKYVAGLARYIYKYYNNKTEETNEE
jgi:RHS repeat-associated protein